jgi:DNA topoisomerase I
MAFVSLMRRNAMSTRTSIERLQSEGILRRGTSRRGFRYVLAGSGRPSRVDRQRIAALRLPPAWRDVAISRSPSARLQAIGRDAAGRWQYVYHAAHVRARERAKHRRLLHFGAALPALRQGMSRDLRGDPLARDAVLAVVVRILAAACLRPGSEAYAAENGSYGIATLRRRHVAVKGATVHFDFPGKSRQRQRRSLRDALVARAVRRMLKLPGYELFKYVADGRVVDLRSGDITEYIKRRMGDRFTAKDFRTWSGTLICACALARAATAEPPANPRARRSLIARALRETAAQLGNTPAVCRKSYVSPCVLESFESGAVLDASHAAGVERLLAQTRPGLHRAERGLLRLLTRHAPKGR